MIQKGTYGTSFRLRLYPFPEGKIEPERPQRQGGRNQKTSTAGTPRLTAIIARMLLMVMSGICSSTDFPHTVEQRWRRNVS